MNPRAAVPGRKKQRSHIHPGVPWDHFLFVYSETESKQQAPLSQGQGEKRLESEEKTPEEWGQRAFHSTCVTLGTGEGWYPLEANPFQPSISQESQIKSGVSRLQNTDWFTHQMCTYQWRLTVLSFYRIALGFVWLRGPHFSIHLPFLVMALSGMHSPWYAERLPLEEWNHTKGILDARIKDKWGWVRGWRGHMRMIKTLYTHVVNRAMKPVKIVLEGGGEWGEVIQGWI
jgi:hypothetical protein